ncbi:glycosyl hydrolase family 18 protein [Bariatricus sp. SGI.154]|uniref:glycosyl hydrolase family 18 protein n=1 Tax=Bariatricus sp. SGI.154 TaxID=3420549 RepID=UPI003D05C1B7
MEDKEKKSRTTSDRLDGTESVRQYSQGQGSVKQRPQGQRSIKQRSQGQDSERRRSQGQDSMRQRSQSRDSVRQRSKGRDSMRQRSQSQEFIRQQAQGPEAKRQRSQNSVSRRSQLTQDMESGRQQARPSGSRKQPVRKKQSRRRRKRNLGIKIFLVIILAIAAVVAAFLWKRYSPSEEKYDLNKYYGIEQEGQLAITVDNQVVEPHGMIADGKAYIQYDIVRNYINSRFYWDPNENILLYTLPNDTVSVGVGSKDYNVSKEKKSEDYVILKTEGSTAYIALDFIQQYTNIEYELYDDPSRVMIVTDWGETTVATVKRDTQVRYQGGVKSPVLTEISKKDEVTIVESEENWKKVRTKDGFIGYVKNSALKKEETKNISRDFEEQQFTNISKDYTINMAWHNVTNNDANSGVLQRIAESKGLTTIAPTWFHVQDTDGNLQSIASADYVNYAHQSNIEVWAAVRDFDGGINSYEETYEMLRYTSKRENLINQLISEVLRVGIDGINVDFEKVSDECGEHYIQFIRELSVRCRQNGIVLSVDNYVPKGYNMQYDRKEQGIVADYVVIMGYDEYYAGSPQAGPVSSYNYVKEGIEETLKEVPAEKVISGIPFFTRLWEETPKTEEELASQAGTEEAEYTMNVNSQALDMASAQAKLAEAGVQTTWDETIKQNYATWTVENTTYEIWLEDEQSIEPKLQLMKENKLAGTAAWALGQENAEIWNLILKYVN